MVLALAPMIAGDKRERGGDGGGGGGGGGAGKRGAAVAVSP